MPREFVLPDLGEGIHEAQIVRVMIKAGERVAEDQYLMEVETDKAAVEIPSPYGGIAHTVHVQEGQTVNVGDVIVTFDDGEGGGASASRSATAKPAGPAPCASTVAATTGEQTAAASGAQQGAKAKTSAAAAPAVRKRARELNVDLDRVAGSGPGGRVTMEDIERHASPVRAGIAGPMEAAAAPARRDGTMAALQAAALLPGVADSDKWGSIRRVPLNQIRKTIATQMSRSAFTIPHVTHGDEADITELDRMRRSLNDATGGEPKLTAMSFLIRAICLAIRKYPIFNASFDADGGQIIYKDYVNMGIAVDTERGLIVPVIRDADKLGLRGIGMALRTIADKVRTNQFAIEDLRGGSFTVTNVGALGGTFSTPIVNYPEVAILGLGRSRKVAVVRAGQLAESSMLPISLSFDHRATDGANAARFTREIIGYLETPAKFLLD